MTKELYSQDGENFLDCLATVLDKCDENEQSIIYVGEEEQLKYSKFIDPRYIIELIEEKMYEHFGEYSYQMSLEIRLDESEAEELKGLINKFLTEKKGEFKYKGVKNVEEKSIDEYR